MGKWSPGYCDQVLNSKIKSLINGAIKRYKLEKTEPEINFELFAKQLDAGDSFTTSLVDILVTEIADRQSRSNVDDRRLIGEKTARSLRLLTQGRLSYSSSASSSSRSYARARRSTGGRAFPHARIPMFLTSPPDAMNLDDDDDEEDFVASIAEAESSLRRRDLILDSYTQSGPGSSNSSASTVAGSTFVVPTFAERSASPAPMASDETSLPPSFSSSSRPSWSYITPNSGLTRASSIRRPTRSRTVDFNDFTSRRRSTIRSTGADENSSERDRDRGASIPPSASTSRARRFFPGLSRRIQAEPDSDIHLWSELDAPDTGIPDGNGLPTPASSFNPSGRFRHFRLSNYPSYHSSLYHSDDTATAEEGENEPTSDERNVQGDGEGVADGASSGRARAPTPSIIPLPRLRRGGLRAPESLLSRDASSLIVVADGGQEAAADTSRRAPSPPEMSFSDYLVRDLASGPNLAEGGRAGSEGGNEIRGADFGLFEVSEPTPSRSVPYGAFGYPTPGSSIDNEGV